MAALLVAGPLRTRSIFAAEEKAIAPRVDFRRDIQPIFAQHCLRCHGQETQKSGYRLDQKRSAIAGGDLGEAAIASGAPERSPLWKYVSGTGDLSMPPDGEKLSPDQITLLRHWIEQGADWPDDADNAESDSPHWAFQPLTKPQPPVVNNPDARIHNPIDAFIVARLEAERLKPSPAAAPQTLVRRLYFNLIGLPPSPREIAEFDEQPGSDAYERLVDRLLDSPQFGERWARHWLDVVRFAESNGFETNQPRPNAWHYRDYVIGAFNRDLPYDRFLQEQLAGDLLGSDAATGFLVAGPWDAVKSPDPVLTAQQRADELHDIVSTTGSALLGLTVGCARCHSHKFDPVSQLDYYAIKAVFAGVQHGERELRPADWPDRQAKLARVRGELETVDRDLREYQPRAYLGQVVILDDATAGTSDINSPSVRALREPRGQAEHASGTARGERDDPGDPGHLPNIGKSYTWWQAPPNTDVFQWNPRLTGKFRVWISWGCGWDTHAEDAQYLFDSDGDPATITDQRLLAVVDQRRFAETSEPLVAPNRPLWSNFRQAGIQEFGPNSCLILRSGNSDRPVTADCLLFEEVPAPAGADDVDEAIGVAAPHLRMPVTRGENVELFAPVTARFVRFVIEQTNQGEPCLDELEIFAAGSDSQNVALASRGAVCTASSTLPGFAIHKLEHLNDGRYGNDWSWISNEAGRGWVMVELKQPQNIDRVVWSRDRAAQPRYADRTATRYRLEVSLDGQTWTTVAGSADRLPINNPWKLAAIPTSPGMAAASASRLLELVARKTALMKELPSVSEMPRAYAGQFVKPEATHRLHRGDPTQPREAVSPGALQAFGGEWRLDPQTPEYDRRKALAEWITSTENPLTARVIVNRIWHYHFGTGIVDTPSDFGRNGGRPSHPELLDWLASELIESSWSLKQIHRLICCSATYRQSSAGREQELAVDAGSRLLWRFPSRRIEAEVLRDSMLQVSGNLNSSMGGPGFDLFEPNTNYVKVYYSRREFGAETFRRMVYQQKPRMQLDDTFGAFDCPDAGQIAPRRNSSTTPLQALSLLNSPFALQQADLLAERVRTEVGPSTSVERQVAHAFRLSLGRDPAPEELRAAADLVATHGLASVCRALFNSHEFLTIP
jgi:mono/diheme cytochrome c family protein